MIINNFSFLLALVHTFLIFLLLLRTRFSAKKTIKLCLAFLLPVILINIPLAVLFEDAVYDIFAMLTIAIPCIALFLFMAEKRDNRFFFTLCIADTVCLEIIYLTQILNYYISSETGIFMLVSRLSIFPVIEILIIKFLRPIYLEVQEANKRRWGHFSFIGAIFFILIILSVNYPSPITERPEAYAPLFIIFILMPIIYLDIIFTLKQQLQMSQMVQQENILKLQTTHVIARVEELAKANEHFREERHNYRHKMKTIASLVSRRQYDELELLVNDYSEAIQKTKIVRYCNNTILDAVLSSYLNQAESKGIRLELGFAFPDQINVNITELATVFANAIENAIQACEQLPAEKRFIEIKVLSEPRFMIMIKNSFDGKVEFSKKGVPVNRADGHGFGTRSIVAFCEKHGAFWRFVAGEDEFALYLNF